MGNLLIENKCVVKNRLINLNLTLGLYANTLNCAESTLNYDESIKGIKYE